MTQAYFFEGGEAINSSNLVEIDDWTEADIHATFIKRLGTEWAESDVGGMFDDDEYLLKDSIQLVGTNMAQAITDAEDGGMIYLVRAD